MQILIIINSVYVKLNINIVLYSNSRVFNVFLRVYFLEDGMNSLKISTTKVDRL